MTPSVADTIHFLCRLTKRCTVIWHCISWLHYFLIAKTWNCNVWEGKGANVTFTTANMNLINSKTRNIFLTLYCLQWLRFGGKLDTLTTSYFSWISWRGDIKCKHVLREESAIFLKKQIIFYRQNSKRGERRILSSVLVMGKQPRWEVGYQDQQFYSPKNTAVAFVFMLSTPRNVLYCPMASGYVFKNDSTFQQFCTWNCY